MRSLSHGLWEHTAPAHADLHRLPPRHETDVAIIGGGYTGLSTALHLALAGARVTVLEGQHIGFGGSGRNSGFVNAGMWMPPDHIVGALGSHFGERLIDVLGRAPATVFSIVRTYGIACELQTAGTLHCAIGDSGQREIEARRAQWAARGIHLDLLGPEETARKTGSRFFRGALQDMRAGTIQPLAYARGLASAAAKEGALIQDGTPVTAAAQDGKRWVLTCGTGTVTADWVVVATEAYTKAPWPQVRQSYVHLPYFNMATRPVPQAVLETILPERQAAFDTSPLVNAFRLDAAGRLVIGSVGSLRGVGAGIHRAWARRTLRAVFPQVPDVEIESAWFGQIGKTDDNTPRMNLLAPNVIAVGGYNGRGIAPGTVFGQLTADFIGGRVKEADLPLPLTKPAPVAWRPLKEAYYEMGANLAHAAAARF